MHLVVRSVSKDVRTDSDVLAGVTDFKRTRAQTVYCEDRRPMEWIQCPVAVPRHLDQSIDRSLVFLVCVQSRSLTASNRTRCSGSGRLHDEDSASSGRITQCHSQSVPIPGVFLRIIPELFRCDLAAPSPAAASADSLQSGVQMASADRRGRSRPEHPENPHELAIRRCWPGNRFRYRRTDPSRHHGHDQ